MRHGGPSFPTASTLTSPIDVVSRDESGDTGAEATIRQAPGGGRPRRSSPSSPCAAARGRARSPSRSARPPRSRRTAAREPLAGLSWYAARAIASARAAEHLEDRVGEQLGVAQPVGHAVRGDRVLEVAGVTDQRPAGSPRLADVTGDAGPAPAAGSSRTASSTRSTSAGAADGEQGGEGLLAAGPAQASHPLRGGPDEDAGGPVVGGQQPGGRRRRRTPTRSRRRRGPST